MSCKKNRPKFQKQPVKRKKKSARPKSPVLKKRLVFSDAVKLISLENTLASRVKDKHILRASSLYTHLQKKIIKARIAQINFN